MGSAHAYSLCSSNNYGTGRRKNEYEHLIKFPILSSVVRSATKDVQDKLGLFFFFLKRAILLVALIRYENRFLLLTIPYFLSTLAGVPRVKVDTIKLRREIAQRRCKFQ